MTKDEIIKLARDAAAKHGHTFKEHPNDAVLEIIAEAYAMGAADEREVCALIAEQGFRFAHDGDEIADKIRSQS